jgi:hypothetical protein
LAVPRPDCKQLLQTASCQQLLQTAPPPEPQQTAAEEESSAKQYPNTQQFADLIIMVSAQKKREYVTYYEYNLQT